MKKAVIFRMVSYIAFDLVLVFLIVVGFSLAQKDIVTITISGEVIFEEYLKGPILITATKEGPLKKPLNDIVATKIISEPGEFFISVPKDIGNIYLEAVNITGEDEKREPVTADSFGEAIENPIKVGSSDIKNIIILMH